MLKMSFDLWTHVLSSSSSSFFHRMASVFHTLYGDCKVLAPRFSGLVLQLHALTAEIWRRITGYSYNILKFSAFNWLHMCNSGSHRIAFYLVTWVFAIFWIKAKDRNQLNNKRKLSLIPIKFNSMESRIKNLNRHDTKNLVMEKAWIHRCGSEFR